MTHDDHLREMVGLPPVHGLRCGCCVEARGEELHVMPCSPDHAEAWERMLPSMLDDLGIGSIPFEVIEDL